MSRAVKNTVYLALLAIIIYSATMSVPMLYNSRWKVAAQGGAAGLMLAAILSILPILAARKKQSK